MSRPLFPKRGEIWLTDFNRKKEREINKIRPVLIISKDTQNELAEKITVVIITTNDLENILPVEFFINNTPETGLDHPSKILSDSPFTWDKELRFKKKLGMASKEIMEKVKKAWGIAFVWEE